MTIGEVATLAQEANLEITNACDSQLQFHDIFMTIFLTNNFLYYIESDRKSLHWPMDLRMQTNLDGLACEIVWNNGINKFMAYATIQGLKEKHLNKSFKHLKRMLT